MLAQRHTEPEGTPWAVVSGGVTPFSDPIDPNGNMTSDGSKAYEWDAEDRLVAVKEGTSTIASYAYNKDGIRTSKAIGGVTTTYLLHEGSVVEERTAGTTTKHSQGPGIDSVLAMQDGLGIATYFTGDHIGSIREHVSTAGEVTLRRDYDPWGNLTIGGGVGGWAFTGREWEPAIALYYYRARYYEPARGRFMSQDPIAFRGGSNFYTYARNQPPRFADPFGLAPGGCVPSPEEPDGVYCPPPPLPPTPPSPPPPPYKCPPNPYYRCCQNSKPLFKVYFSSYWDCIKNFGAAGGIGGVITTLKCGGGGPEVQAAFIAGGAAVCMHPVCVD